MQTTTIQWEIWCACKVCSPEEGKTPGRQGEVSGFDLGNQSYEIQSKFINISWTYSANFCGAWHCVRYWRFGHEKDTAGCFKKLLIKRGDRQGKQWLYRSIYLIWNPWRQMCFTIWIFRKFIWCTYYILHNTPKRVWGSTPQLKHVTIHAKWNEDY